MPRVNAAMSGSPPDRSPRLLGPPRTAIRIRHPPQRSDHYQKRVVDANVPNSKYLL